MLGRLPAGKLSTCDPLTRQRGVLYWLSVKAHPFHHHGSIRILSSRFLKSGSLPHGSIVRALVENTDERGSFTEFLCNSWGTGLDAVQWSLVKSHAGTLRGMHLHQRHDEFFFLSSGRCCVGLRDIRPDSPTRDRSCLLEFSATKPAVVSFPRGVLHGWYFYEDSVHIQAITDEEYAHYYADDNVGCHWSDPALEIPWPCTPTIVSDRAAAFPDLDTLLRTAYGQTSPPHGNAAEA